MMLKEESYTKYESIENIILNRLVQLELKKDKYVYGSRFRAEQIIKRIIEKIYQSENYRNYINLDEEIGKIEIINDIKSLYSEYLSNDKIKEIEKEILKLKFNLLYRKQVENLIYGNEEDNSYLSQTNSLEEMHGFEEILKEKIEKLKNQMINASGHESKKIDEVLQLPIKEIINDKTLLERLIIIDIKQNPYEFINLMKAKIFNPHLCTIGNNPYEIQEYALGLPIERTFNFTSFMLGDKRCRRQYENEVPLETNAVNYSLLKSIMTLIKDDNMNFLECEKIYQRFGFSCYPILMTLGQQCIKLISDSTKGSQEYEDLFNNTKQDNERQDECYCRLKLVGIKYEYDQKLMDKAILTLQDEIINMRKMNSSSRRKGFKSFYYNSENNLQLDEAKKIKEKGILITDIEVLEILINHFAEEGQKQYLLNIIQELKEIKHSGGLLKKDSGKKYLYLVREIYDKCGVEYYRRSITPLIEAPSSILRRRTSPISR